MIVALLSACAEIAPHECEDDLEAPVLHGGQLTRPQRAERDVLIEQLASDACGMPVLALTFRNEGSDWATVEMVPVGLLEDDRVLYQGVIRAQDVVPPALEYYWRATDAALNVTFLPAEGEAAPWSIAVVAD